MGHSGLEAPLLRPSYPRMRKMRRLACANYTDTTTNAPKVRLPALLRLDRSTDVPIQANLFYVDPTNVLQEVISTDNFQTWQTGTLGNSAVRISPSAFAMSSFYLPESGLRLYYGGVDGLVHELVYISGDGIWSEQFRFESSNGNGGICHSVYEYDGNPGLAQLYMLDSQNNIRVWNLTITPTVISNWTLGNYLQPPSMIYSLTRCYRSVAR